MSNYFAVKIDINSKQSYIFSSNRLKEIIGASKIIEFTTEILGPLILLDMEEDGDDVSLEHFSKNQNGNLHTAAGGNSIYFFSDEKLADKFSRKFSSYVLSHFSGLEIILVREKFDIKKDSALSLYDKLDKKILIEKNKLPHNRGIMSFGMYTKCPNNGKPAGYEINVQSDINPYEFNKKYVSLEVFHKNYFYDEIINNKKFTKNSQNKFNLPMENDFYGVEKYLNKSADNQIKEKIQWMRHLYIKSDENEVSKLMYEKNTFLNENDERLTIYDFIKSINKVDTIDRFSDNYVGLTMVDGDNMGNRIRKTRNNFEYLEKNFSGISKEDINIAFLCFFEALTKTIKKTYETGLLKLIGEFKDYNKELLEIVPIISAGDDISFWVPGKKSIYCTKTLMTHLINMKNVDSSAIKKEMNNNRNIPQVILDSTELNTSIEKFQVLSVSGGISITGKTYPVAVSAKLASKLESNAKEKKSNFEIIDESDAYNICALDWELVRGDISENIFDSTSREHTGRPYMIFSNFFKNKYNNKSNESNESNKFDEFDEIFNNNLIRNLTKENFDNNSGNAKSKLQNYFNKLMSDQNEAKLFFNRYFNKTDNYEKNLKILQDTLEIRDFYETL